MKETLNLGMLCFTIVLFANCGTSTTSESKAIKDCLVGYDWCQPSCSNPTMAWKFSSDGTFNYSTIMFGGMSALGTWKDTGDNQIEIV